MFCVLAGGQLWIAAAALTVATRCCCAQQWLSLWPTNASWCASTAPGPWVA